MNAKKVNKGQIIKIVKGYTNVKAYLSKKKQSLQKKHIIHWMYLTVEYKKRQKFCEQEDMSEEKQTDAKYFKT